MTSPSRDAVALPPLALLLATVPAVAGSVLLMRAAGVGPGPVVLQLAAFGLVAVLMVAPPRRPTLTAFPCWGVLVLAAALAVPVVVYDQAGPQRWLLLGGVRLYVAPVVLPVLLVALGRNGAMAGSRAACASLAVAGSALALLLQPDAAQLDALALSVLPVLWTASLPRAAKLAVWAAVAACAVAAWQRPDPLLPVPHVEGVFDLATAWGPVGLPAALVAVALPVVGLAWSAWASGSMGLLAAAVYYATVLAHAPLQITPIPWLGFGAGPLLGYGLVCLAAAGRPSPRRDTLAAG
ncbi:MAG: hypothetical protein AB7O67_08215 [Vicinamibacterales bacterium]